MATVAAILLGIAAGVIATLIEAGILLDPRTESAYRTSGHLRAFGILVLGSVPGAVLESLHIVWYLTTAPATFLVGMVVIFIRWWRASAKS